MRGYLAASTVLGLALAAPAPQDIDFALAEALPNPTFSMAADATAQTVTYNPTTIFASAVAQITTSVVEESGTPNKVKRSACQPLPSGYGPVPSPDTPSAFLALASFAAAATNAPVPSGYAQTFQNLEASNNAYGYMGYTVLQSYDVAGCAKQCNNINGCMAFNIYFERDPTFVPGSGCDNPSSTTNIKCVWWGGPVSASNAVNNGQYRDQFQVVIAGSNGYVNQTLIPPAGYGPAVDLGNAAINAPYDKYGANTFLGAAIFNSGPFNVSLCAQACSMKSAYALAHPPSDGSPVQTCQFFNTYILYINSTNDLQGQYCAMYSETWSSSYATNTGQYRGHDHYLIEYSYAFSNTTNPGTACASCAVAQASEAISYSSLQPYCSSLLGYTTPITTTTSYATTTPVTTVTSTSIIPATATSTIFAKRAASSIVLPNLSMLTPTPASQNNKRAVSTPAGLTQYPASIISSACSEQAVPVTSTSTVTQYSTVTAGTSTTVVVVDQTVTSTVDATVTPSCTPGAQFRILVTNSGTGADGNFIAGEDAQDLLVGAGGGYTAFPDFEFTLNSNGALLVTDGTPIHIDTNFYSPPVLAYDPGNEYTSIQCSMGTNQVITCEDANDASINTFSVFSVAQSGENYYDLALGTAGQGGNTATLVAVC